LNCRACCSPIPGPQCPVGKLSPGNTCEAKRSSSQFCWLSLGPAVAAETLKEAPGYNPRNDNFEEEAPWQEQRDIEPPAFPADDVLVEIYVSPVATNKYFIDSATLAPGKDGVVRYVLVVKTSGGATNVSFEGIHCAERKWKHYATGRYDKTWSKTQVQRGKNGVRSKTSH
jgi:hypothetical protein